MSATSGGKRSCAVAEPTYTHDCDVCEFLGSVEGPDPYRDDCPRTRWDLYYCPSSSRGTILARDGNEGSEYLSCPLSILQRGGHHPALAWGLALFEERERRG